MGKSLKLKSGKGWWGYHRGRSQQDEGIQNPFPYGQRIKHSDERLMQVPTIMSCGRILSETVASLPLRLFTADSGPDRPVTDHWLMRLLRKPNSRMTSYEFKQAMELYVVNWGNAYALIIRDGRNIPVGLQVLLPWNMEVVVCGSDVEYHYSQNGTTKTNVFKNNEIFHLKGFGDGNVGYSTLGWMASTIGVSVSANDYMATFLENDCKQPGILQIDRELNAAQREKAKANYSSLTNHTSGRLTVLEGNSTFSPTSLSPIDAQMIDARIFNAEEIAGFLGVPLHLVGHTQKTTSFGAGVEELNIRFLQYGIKPRLDRWEAAIERWLLNGTSGGSQLRVSHDTTEILRTDIKSQAEWVAAMKQNAVLDTNEIRNRIGYSERDDDGANTLVAQLNLTPIGQLGIANESTGNQVDPSGPDQA